MERISAKRTGEQYSQDRSHGPCSSYEKYLVKCLSFLITFPNYESFLKFHWWLFIDELVILVGGEVIDNQSFTELSDLSVIS